MFFFAFLSEINNSRINASNFTSLNVVASETRKNNSQETHENSMPRYVYAMHYFAVNWWEAKARRKIGILNNSSRLQFSIFYDRKLFSISMLLFEKEKKNVIKCFERFSFFVYKFLQSIFPHVRSTITLHANTLTQFLLHDSPRYVNRALDCRNFRVKKAVEIFPRKRFIIGWGACAYEHSFLAES